MGRIELQIYFSFSSWLQTKSLLSFETQNFSFLLKNSFSGVQRSTTSPISLKFSLWCSHFLNLLECLSSLDPYTKCWKSQGLLCIDLFHFCSVNVVFFFSKRLLTLRKWIDIKKYTGIIRRVYSDLCYQLQLQRIQGSSVY